MPMNHLGLVDTPLSFKIPQKTIPISVQRNPKTHKT